MTELQETAAEIAAMVPRYSWELMDEEQRDGLMEKVVLPRWMDTTSDGVKLGPSWWAETVGATVPAIASRVKRLKASQKVSPEKRARAYRDSADRHARVVVRERPDELIDSLSNEEQATLVAKIAKKSPDAVLQAATDFNTRIALGSAIDRGRTEQDEQAEARRTLKPGYNEAREIDALVNVANALGNAVNWMKTATKEAEKAAAPPEGPSVLDAKNLADDLDVIDACSQALRTYIETGSLIDLSEFDEILKGS